MSGEFTHLAAGHSSVQNGASTPVGGNTLQRDEALRLATQTRLERGRLCREIREHRLDLREAMDTPVLQNTALYEWIPRALYGSRRRYAGEQRVLDALADLDLGHTCKTGALTAARKDELHAAVLRHCSHCKALMGKRKDAA